MVERERGHDINEMADPKWHRAATKERTMQVTIKYALSEAGQKASILSGGDGKAEQVMTVAPDHPNFRDVVAAGSVSSDGNVVLNLSGCLGLPNSSWGDQWPKFAEIPTVQDLLSTADMERRKDIERGEATKREQQEREQRWAAEDAAALAAYAALPLDQRVNGEAVITPPMHDLAKLEVLPAYVEAMAERDRRLAARKADEKAKADAVEAAKAAWRELHGLEDDDTALRVEDGALATVPCWESHSRGKNWLAIITPSPSAPGGLERAFATKAKGDSYYLLPSWKPGDAVEFGADYYSGRGRKNANRWYGFFVRTFVSQSESPRGLPAGTTYAVLRQVGGGKTACKRGQAWVKEHGTTDPGDDVANAIARVNGEGAIVN